MTVHHLKRATRQASTGERDVRARVQAMLDALESEGDAKAAGFARELDRWEGPIVVSREQMAAAGERVDAKLKDDIRFAHDNVRRFAEAQRATLVDVELEILPGLVAGQRQIAMPAVGCYVPGGRYSHVASAIMTVTTAKVAGVAHVTAVSPPRPGEGIPAPILYTLELCGADAVLTLGGVQGVAAMAFGLFGTPAVNLLVGPGNPYVAEAKRILYGRVGIDLFAGPTESLVIADASADPLIVAADLVGQAEHGHNSPVWLVSVDRGVAERVGAIVPTLIAELPETNRQSAEAAWRDYGEIVVVDDREAAARLSDDYAPEHLQVQAADLDWWLGRLRNYGSLFLGEETTVAFGDKCSGPNHVLPTKRAATYTGGLSVGKFMKTVTWQRMSREANRSIAQACARISRLEGMEAHARTADVRLAKYFPGETFDLAAGPDGG